MSGKGSCEYEISGPREPKIEKEISEEATK